MSIGKRFGNSGFGKAKGLSGWLDKTVKPHSTGLARILIAFVTAAALAAFMVDWMPLDGVAGLQAGDISPSDIRASSTVEVVDHKLTEERRLQSVALTAPVFDYDVILARNQLERIDKAFAAVREFLATTSLSQGQVPVGAVDRISGTRSLVPESTTRSVVDPARLEQELLRFEQTLAIPLRDTDLASLQTLQFAESVQRDIKELVRASMMEYVALDRQNIPAQGPIAVVRSEGSESAGFRLEDLSQVRVLDDARRFIARTSAADFADRPAHVLETITYIAQQLCAPNLRFEASETAVRRQRASASTQPVTRTYQAGQVICREGDALDAWTMLVIDQMGKEAQAYSPLRHFGALTVLLLLFLWFLGLFSQRFISKFRRRTAELFSMAVLLVIVASAAALLQSVAVGLANLPTTVPLVAYGYLVPVAVGGIMVRMLMNSETTVVWSVVASFVCAIIMDGGLWLGVFYMVSSIAAAGSVRQRSERGGLIRAGAMAALVNAAMVVLISGVHHLGLHGEAWVGADNLRGLTIHIFFACAGGLIAGVLALGLVPLFESIGFLTESRLLELSSLNHPLLREMTVKAPGSYHHSMVVGSLAEAAADAIHANSLLVRVGACFHDLGKMLKPQYFIENQRGGVNPHDRLTPSMSALVIINHVKEGVELARSYGLPRPVIDMIPQHHGTSRVSFFYNKAVEQLDPGKGEVDEMDYRYPGPKPQTREAGLMMLADGVEASTRSLQNITPGAVRGQVAKIVNHCIADGQLDECPLTLKDLHVVSETFVQAVLSYHHHRVQYPDPLPSQDARGRSKQGSITLEFPSNTPSPDHVTAATREFQAEGPLSAQNAADADLLSKEGEVDETAKDGGDSSATK